MDSKRPKTKIRIQYRDHYEPVQPFIVEPTYQALNQTAIALPPPKDLPDAEKWRKQKFKTEITTYMHALVVLTENIDANPSLKNVKRLRQVQEKVIKYHGDNRLKLGKKIRRVIWKNICRIEVLCFDPKEGKGKLSHFPQLDLMRLLVTEKDLLDFTQNEFVNAVDILLKKINFIPYVKKETALYFHFLYIRSCQLNSYQLKKTVLDDRTYSQNGKVSDKFVDHCERTFYHLTQKIIRCKVLRKLRQTMLPVLDLKRAVTNLLDLLPRQLNGSHKVLIDEDYQEAIFDDYVFPSEIEEFKVDVPAIEALSRNVVSRKKNHQYNTITENLQKRDISVMVEQRKELHYPTTPGETPVIKFIDREFETYCYFTLKQLFESDVAQEKTLIENLLPRYILIRDFAMATDEQSHKFPYVLRDFSTFVVYYKGLIQSVRSFEEGFVYWVYIVAHDQKIKGIFPDCKGAHINQLYKAIFQRDMPFFSQTEEQHYTVQDDDLPMPDHYQ